MGHNSLIFAVFLVCSCQIQGFRTVTPVFVQKGNDVPLDVTTADVVKRDFDVVLWKFNNRVILVRLYSDREPKFSDNYTGRIVVKNYSIILKNLQEADSGVYTAQVTGAKEEQIAEYNVTVQDPVPPVELTVDSVSNSSDSCNLTVTCSTADSHISSTFRCDTKTCSQEGGERSEVTTSGASLHVYLVNDSITCNHSNKVSTTKNMTDIQHFCPRHTDLPTRGHHVILLVLVPIVIIILIILAPVLHHQWKRKYKRVNVDNTIYTVPQTETTPQQLDPTTVPSGVSPTSTYSLVGQHSGCVESETRGQSLPESLYAQVQRSPSS